MLVQTQSELQNTNPSDLKESILSFGCVLGQGQNQCIYKDKQSLLNGKMTLAAKKKLMKV